MEYKYLYHDRADEYMPRYDAMNDEERFEELSELELEQEIWEHQLLDELEQIEKDPDKNCDLLFYRIRLVLFSAQKKEYLYRHIGRQSIHDYLKAILRAYDALNSMGDKSFKRSTSEEYRELVDKVNEYHILNSPKLWRFFAWLLTFIVFWIVLFRMIAAGALAEIASSSIMETVMMAVFTIGIIALGIKLWLDTSKILVAIAVPLVGGALVLVILTYVSKWAITLLPGMAEALKDANEYFFPVLFLLFLISFVVTLLVVSANAPAFTKKRKLAELESDLYVMSHDEDLYDEAFFFGLMVDAVDFCENMLEAGSEYYIIPKKTMNKDEVNNILSKVRRHFSPLLTSYNQAVKITTDWD